MFFAALDRLRRGRLACVFDATDRIQHMFWRYLEPGAPGGARRREPAAHARRDRASSTAATTRCVGRGAASSCGDGDVLMVLSDHGFTSFRRGVNLNAWLLRERLPGAEGGRRRPRRVAARRRLVADPRLRARPHRASSSTSRGARRRASSRRATRRQRAQGRARSPSSAACATRRRGEVGDQRGRSTPPSSTTARTCENAPDLARRLQRRLPHRRGTAPPAWSPGPVFEDNAKAWSGDHCVDPRLVPGVFFCNRTIDARRPGAHRHRADGAAALRRRAAAAHGRPAALRATARQPRGRDAPEPARRESPRAGAGAGRRSRAGARAVDCAGALAAARCRLRPRARRGRAARRSSSSASTAWTTTLTRQLMARGPAAQLRAPRARRAASRRSAPRSRRRARSPGRTSSPAWTPAATASSTSSTATRRRCCRTSRRAARVEPGRTLDARRVADPARRAARSSCCAAARPSGRCSSERGIDDRRSCASRPTSRPRARPRRELSRHGHARHPRRLRHVLLLHVRPLRLRRQGRRAAARSIASSAADGVVRAHAPRARQPASASRPEKLGRRLHGLRRSRRARWPSSSSATRSGSCRRASGATGCRSRFRLVPTQHRCAAMCRFYLKQRAARARSST